MSQRVALLAVVVAIGGLSVGVPSPVGAAPATVAPRTSRGSKLSPRLATLAAGTTFASPRAEAHALSLPASGVGSLVTRPDGRVVVDIRTRDTTAGGVAELRNLGARVENVSPKYSTVTAAVAPRALDAVASDPSVQYVMEVWAPHVGKVSPAHAAAVAHAVSPQACAPIVSEGDSLMNVSSARATNHVDGTGETVGIISDSFNHATSATTHADQDVVNGDLPGPGNPCGHPHPVDVVHDGSGPGQTDEGRAMAQLVHDEAPGATLAFSTVGQSETEFASNIDSLRAQAHPSVLVDDVFFPDEPFFQDGPVATAASTAVAAGVPYFTAAGNANAIVGGNNVASYEAPAYRVAACPTFTNLGYPVQDCHDFDPGPGVDPGDAITVQPGGGFDLDLQWAQPRGAVTSDYDLFVVNGSGTIVAHSSIDNTSAQEPVEFLSWGNTSGVAQTVRLVIARFSHDSATPRLKMVFLDSGGITSVQWNASNAGDIVGPGIVGHAGTDGVATVAAIPYDDSTTPEDYSSRGPVTHYFQPVPSTTALGSPDVIAAPAFTATDGVRTSFFAQQIAGVWRFYGTSAAAPQAAAIGALLLAKHPSLTPAAVVSELHDTARPVANNGTSDVVGGGYLDAAASLAGVTAIAGKPTAVGGTPGDGQVTVHWSAPATNGGIPITGYTITPTLNGVAQTPLPFNSPATSETITGLTNGDHYTFSVTADDANGSSSQSDPSGEVIIGTPTKPTGVAVTGGGNARATLKWVTPSATNGSTITGYTITPFLAGNAQPPTTVGLVNSATITGLVNGDRYTFEVATTSNRGHGEPSDPTSPFTVGLPGPPTNVVAAPGNGSATVAFKPPPSALPIVGYEVESYKGSQLGDRVDYPKATKLKFANLGNGLTYKFRVAALTNAGMGTKSAFSLPIVVGAPTAPGAPRITPGNGSAVLHWTTSAANGATIKRFVVTPIVNGVANGPRTYSSATTHATITGLPNAKKFSFGIKATNSRGTGPEAFAPTVVIGAPTAPTKVSAQPGHDLAVVKWTAPSNTNGAQISAYTVTPILHGVRQKPVVFHSTATTEVVRSVKAGNTYTFDVSATNARGASARSAPSKPIQVF